MPFWRNEMPFWRNEIIFGGSILAASACIVAPKARARVETPARNPYPMKTKIENWGG
jgi:hypothetical protein